MALIKCPECGREISSMAPVCLGCGHPQRSKAGKLDAWRLPLAAAGIAAVALGVFLVRGRSAPDATTESPLEMRVKASAPVCRDENLYNQLINLIVKQDRDDAQKLLDPAVADNQCQVLEAGQMVTVEKGTNLPCVRWSGEPACWYISPTLIELIP